MKITYPACMHARYRGYQAILGGFLLSPAFHWLLVNRVLSLMGTDAAARWVGFGQGMEEEVAEGEVHQGAATACCSHEEGANGCGS